MRLTLPARNQPSGRELAFRIVVLRNRGAGGVAVELSAARPIASFMDDDRCQLWLGKGCLDVWGHLPRDIQEMIFEAAVAEEDATVRPELAKFLHERHPRTIPSLDE